MCGIYGYIQSNSKRKSLEMCLQGLKKLQYRGYDSAGIASIHEGAIFSYKTTGPVDLLDPLIHGDKKELSLAIAHTRWATHGEMSKINAHPHTDDRNTIALVHNGIIENFAALKRDLEEKGVNFSSQTDTEVIANLLSYIYQLEKDMSVLNALDKTLKLLEGSFAIVFIHKDEPETIYAAASGCPLAIGKCTTTNDMYISSDPSSFSNSTYDTIFLKDQQIATIEKDRVTLFDENSLKLKQISQKLSIDNSDNDKRGHEHYMHKEIFEQSHLCREILLKRKHDTTFTFSELANHLQEIEQASNIEIIGCGSSFHAAMIAREFLEKQLQIPVFVHLASEYRYSDHIDKPGTVGIFISQSGETADTLKALECRKRAFSLLIGLCNEKNSTLSRLCEHYIPIGAKKEISVCSTKAFTAQLLNLYLLGMFFSEVRGNAVTHLAEEIKHLPYAVDAVLAKEKAIAGLAHKYSSCPFFFFTGRRSMYPVSMEAALKLKEISYIYAEAICSGELKHGPIALIDETMTTVAFLGDKRTKDKVLSNLHEVEARKGNILIFGKSSEKTKKFDLVEIDDMQTNTFISIPYSIASQLFAYHVAHKLGKEIDFPKNLAKSVTVE